ncbi:hypothetical protein HMPREF0020_01557 [Acinetobacter baumannii 6013113]|nr:hypothetical protein HMPREF0020_01557 [Acinetobacter baumannii 6013113]
MNTCFESLRAIKNDELLRKIRSVLVKIVDKFNFIHTLENH